MFGDYFSKKWTQSGGDVRWLAYGFGVYAVAIASWFILFWEGKILAQIGPIWTAFQCLLCVVVGVVVFDERLTLLHKIGIALAIMSMLLLSTKGNS